MMRFGLPVGLLPPWCCLTSPPFVFSQQHISSGAKQLSGRRRRRVGDPKHWTPWTEGSDFVETMYRRSNDCPTSVRRLSISLNPTPASIRPPLTSPAVTAAPWTTTSQPARCTLYLLRAANTAFHRYMVCFLQPIFIHLYHLCCQFFKSWTQYWWKFKNQHFSF